MPRPDIDYRHIGRLYIETHAINARFVIGEAADGEALLSRAQVIELRDFLNQQYPPAVRASVAQP